jgi:cellulose synthase/poly-beta-1,6-N-acetylglucosamine synthase-like glycosyltransferase
MNAASTLADCLLALRAQTLPKERVEVIVVDDGSTDKTAAIAAKYRAHVVQIANAGPAVARNRGVEVAVGSILVFTDADCAPEPSFLEEILRPFEDEDVVATKGVYHTDQGSLTARFVQAEYESRYRIMLRLDSIDFVDTYAAAYRRDAFEAVGGFDESFPLPSVEDQDLSFRFARGGARMVFCPKAVVTHHHANDPVAYFRKKMKIGYWKMRVLARFPEKAVSDSHTPSSMKIEILSVALIVASLPVALISGWWWPPLAFFAVFLVASSWFCFTVARKDLLVGMVSPLFVLVRSLALGTGMACGLLRGQLESTQEVSTLEASRENAEEAVKPRPRPVREHV